MALVTSRAGRKRRLVPLCVQTEEGNGFGRCRCAQCPAVNIVLVVHTTVIAVNEQTGKGGVHLAGQ